MKNLNYSTDPINSVLNMDRMDWLNQFPDKFFDWYIDDPPYFSGPEKREYYGSEISATGVKRVNYPITDNWEVPGKDYFDLAIQKSKEQIFWGVNYYDYPFGSGRIIWDKVNPNTSFSDCEIAYVSSHDSVRMFRYMWNGFMQGKSLAEGNVMQGNKKLNEKRIHPSQKPIRLYRWLLMKYTKPGDKIGDGHVGSGSSRIVADEYGCHFYGAELNEVTFNLQEERFNLYKELQNEKKPQFKLQLY